MGETVYTLRSLSYTLLFYGSLYVARPLPSLLLAHELTPPMLAAYENRSGALVRQDGGQGVTKDTVWIDLFNPTPEEEATVEQALHLDVPTREEQQEIEASSRLYKKTAHTL